MAEHLCVNCKWEIGVRYIDGIPRCSDCDSEIEGHEDYPVRMTSETLEEIHNRVGNATAGQWKVYEKPDGKHIGTSWNHPQLKSPLPIVSLSIYTKEPHHRIYITEENAEFITHAREDVSALLDEIKRLRSELSFITNVDLLKNAYDAEHVAMSIRSWALDVLDGINHDDN